LYRPRFLRLALRYLVACAILLTGVVGLFSTSALAAPLGAVPGWSVTIPAGGTGSIRVSGIALQPGASLPTGTFDVAVQSLAPDLVRTALFYGIDWGYTDTAPDQVALAVWWMQNNTWPATDHTVAQRIADTAVTAPGTPSWNPDGRNLLTVMQSGQATLAPLTLTPSTLNPSLGSGTLLVTNTGINSVTVYLPYGTVFSNAGGQVLVWASGTAANPTANPTSQTVATASATATIAAATDTPSPVPPSDTPAPSSNTKGGGTGQPPATATQAQVDTIPTATEQPQLKATAIPTDTPVPTSTSTATIAPTDTATTAVQPTGTPDLSVRGGQVQNSTVPSNNNGAQPEDTTGATANPAQASGVNNGATESIVGGPPLPTETRSGSSNSDTPNTGPAPVGTAISGATPAVPQGVSTAASQAAPPAQTTFQVPVAVPSGVTLIPTGVPSRAVPVATVTKAPTKTAAATNDNPGAKPTPPQKPTPAPTAAPPPVKVIPTQTKNNGGGVVDTTNGNNTKGSGQGTGGGGTPPKVVPVTGGGPSSLPIWLGAASVLMLLGGWMLRKAARKAVIAR
jgi:hypothetical protein